MTQQPDHRRAPRDSSSPPAGAAPARVSRLAFAAWLLVTTLCALLMFAYHYLDDFAGGDPPRLAKALIEEMTGVFACSALFPFVRGMARRFPISRATWMRSVPAHLGALLLFGTTATTLYWISRTLLYQLFGLGVYHYGVMPVRYFMELPLQTICYALFASGVWLFDRSQAEREKALRAAQLESQLKQAQLQGLRLQLQPHFLFNALNTISSTMYDDPRAADTMISRLAELLRVSLRTTQTQEVPLAAELDALDHYLALLRARFGDRLRVELTIDDAARQALVPSLVLQPLVENAVRHGNLARVGTGRIDVYARLQDGQLWLEVEDDGPGPDANVIARLPAAVRAPADGAHGADGARGGASEESAARAEAGVGLAATSERLRLLYGEASRLTLHTAPARRSFSVRFSIPFRLATPAVHSSDPVNASSMPHSVSAGLAGR